MKILVFKTKPIALGDGFTVTLKVRPRKSRTTRRSVWIKVSADPSKYRRYQGFDSPGSQQVGFAEVKGTR